MNRCLICGKEASDRHHLIGGTANRRISDRYKLTVYLCRECHRMVHDDPKWNLALKRYGQKLWEDKYGSREEFIKIFGKSWLDIGGNDDDS